MIKVVELFAGVGGFRLGLEGLNGNSSSSNYTKKLKQNYKIVFSNQYEPSTPKRQHANWVYENIWGKKNHYPKDINEIAGQDLAEETINNNIPNHDLLVGGFPCQDYSVAGINTKGIQGKKGVLWWNIHKIIEVKKPDYILLENVDRLLKSPTNMRGRDFAIMLRTLVDLGYTVEWKVINAGKYGMPQRRKRVFIMCYKINSKVKISNAQNWIENDGVLAKSFPGVKKGIEKKFKLSLSAKVITNEFQHGKFLNCGIINHNNNVITFDYDEKIENLNKKKYSSFHTLGDVVNESKDIHIPNNFIVTNTKLLKKTIIKIQGENSTLSYLKNNEDGNAELYTELDKWKYLKGKKKEERTSSRGVFYYSEGPMSLSDSLNKPSRTIITSEGGPGPSRFKHLIEITKDKKYRRLLPSELELLNMFPLNHTSHPLISDSKRAFFMGNALVVGVIEKIGLELAKKI